MSHRTFPAPWQVERLTPLGKRELKQQHPYNLGLMYFAGQGVQQDKKEAERWFRLSAEAGYVDAQYNLAVMYRDGDGVIQDYRESAKWYRLAAEGGNVIAQYNLGVMYR